MHLLTPLKNESGSKQIWLGYWLKYCAVAIPFSKTYSYNNLKEFHKKNQHF